MKTHIKWTNPSVLLLAGTEDPVEVIERRARQVALTARDAGWTGPPFDPIDLATRLGIQVEARDDVPDARTIAAQKGFVIEFNPRRPRGRVRFSVAHEIAHSFFPDCDRAIRHRGGSGESRDEWQLEVLCNIAAAELLMPTGSFAELQSADLNIIALLKERQKFDVSIEATLLRTIKLAREPVAAFCASRRGAKFRLDYVMPSAGWDPDIKGGDTLPQPTVVEEANGIGYTAIGEERWSDGAKLRVEGVALAPYPGSVSPRVVGIIRPVKAVSIAQPRMKEVIGDALSPPDKNSRIIAQVVPDNNAKWGGGGFAAQVRRRFPEYWKAFRDEALGQGLPLPLGHVFKAKVGEGTWIASMVAQRGFGPSDIPRIRYSAVEKSLTSLAQFAGDIQASVHMPRIGTGQAGGDWNVIRELINDNLVSRGLKVTVYQPRVSESN